ncbi:phosphodiesterase [Chromatium okenii]|uniref:HD-GYP domain-containing protein n=1 Tax=Chromatium okenii TaxID=61644 RepID=UPI00190631D7|nr:HD-GYP domain-containing protein [Chromatium okenii]MBK1641484.1 phosphodiesterase [Chromatium okenii]
MIKKIAIEQLKIGMYVHDLNCDWLDHGFIRNQFLLKKETDLLRIREIGICDLYIDTAKGTDAAPAPSARVVTAALEQELVQLDVVPAPQPVPLTAERGRARRIHQEAIGVVSGLMEEARLGHQLNLEQANPVVTEMIGSIFRNQNALLALSRIRQVGRYTFEHSVNVAVLMVAFARALQVERTLIHDIGLGALLHDIGKVLVPPEILNKPGALTDAEFTVMRNHVVYTRDLLAQVPGLPPIALAVAAEHHERVDGSGYPQHKSSADISLYGQMAAIADVYDALTTDRVYHKALEPHQALRKLLEWSNHHFDPTLVQQFIRCVGIYPVGTLVRLHSGRLGVVVETGRQGLLQPVVRVVMDAKRRAFLTAQDVDLSQLPKQSEERIVNAEVPSQWDIDPVQVLALG